MQKTQNENCLVPIGIPEKIDSLTNVYALLIHLGSDANKMLSNIKTAMTEIEEALEKINGDTQ